MEKSVIKRLQSASYSFVAFFFVVFMWACPKFFVKEFCFTLFIGSITLLVVCAIVAQVYLYVRYQDNSRLSWLCTAFLIVRPASLVPFRGGGNRDAPLVAVRLPPCHRRRHHHRPLLHGTRPSCSVCRKAIGRQRPPALRTSGRRGTAEIHL